MMKRKTRTNPGPSGIYKGSRKISGKNGKPPKVEGLEVERALREKWRISLYEVTGTNGDRRRKQYYVCTVTYWDVVDDRYGVKKRGKLFSHAWDRLAALFPDRDHASLRKLIVDRFAPIRREVIKDYQASEEYYFRLIQNLVESKQKSGEGNGRKQQPKRSKPRSDASDSRQSKKRPENFQLSPAPHGLNGDAKAMALEIIQAGYKKVAAKYHPDTGGDTSRMQALNLVRDRLIKLSGALLS